MEKLRPLVVERILTAASSQPTTKILDSTGNDNSGLGTLLLKLFPGGQGPGATVIRLVRLNSVIGLVSVGMLLSALASVSVLRSDEEWTLEDKLRDLQSRRMIIRLSLGLGSVVLVVAVIASKVLIDWPASLLIKAQQIAIAPLGEALNLLFAASCTLCLIAAIEPALVAFLLDKNELLKVPSKASQRPKTATAESAPVEPTPLGLKQMEDDLGFAPLASIGGVIAVLSPLMTPHLMELIKFIIGLHS
jgi:hypothetical protein